MLEHRFESSIADTAHAPLTSREETRFTFVGERLWLDFVNTDDLRRGVRFDALREFETFVQWLEAANVVDGERAAGLRRRAQQQPSGAAAALVDARRVRASLRALAERGNSTEKARIDTLTEINRILGRSAGTRRLEPKGDGTVVTWAMHGPQPLIGKVVSLFIDCETIVGKSFEEGLANLKAITER